MDDRSDEGGGADGDMPVERQLLYNAARVSVEQAAAWLRSDYPRHAAAIAHGLALIERMAGAVDAANANRPADAPLLVLMTPIVVLPSLAPGVADFWPRLVRS